MENRTLNEIVDEIKALGFTTSIVKDADGNTISGNVTEAALKKLSEKSKEVTTMKYLNNHKQELFDGNKVTYRDMVYWANMVTMEVYAHSVDAEISGVISGRKVGDITKGMEIIKAEEA